MNTNMPYGDMLEENPSSPYYNDKGLDKKVADMVIELLSDDDDCQRLLSENSDIVLTIMKSKQDVAVKLNASLVHWAECEAERFYDNGAAELFACVMDAVNSICDDWKKP